MHYPGGKEKLWKEIQKVVLEYKQPQHTTYIEPFIGGGSTFCRNAPLFEKAIASDINEDLVLLWNALLTGWDPPENVTEEEYRKLRHAKESSALRAYAGIGFAFSGVWFGGYIPHAKGVARRGLLEKIEPLRAASTSVKIINADYRTLTKVGPHVLMYTDPPYAQAAFMYKKGARHFNSSEYWRYCFQWADQGAIVLVSEYVAPESDRIEVVWEKEVKKTLNQYQLTEESTHRKKAIEKIYLVKA